MVDAPGPYSATSAPRGHQRFRSFKSIQLGRCLTLARIRKAHPGAFSASFSASEARKRSFCTIFQPVGPFTQTHPHPSCRLPEGRGALRAWSVFRRKLAAGDVTLTASPPFPPPPPATLTALATFRPKPLPAGARPKAKPIRMSLGNAVPSGTGSPAVFALSSRFSPAESRFAELQDRRPRETPSRTDCMLAACASSYCSPGAPLHRATSLCSLTRRRTSKGPLLEVHTVNPFLLRGERALGYSRGTAQASTATAAVVRRGLRAFEISCFVRSGGAARPRGDSLPLDGPPRNRPPC